VAALGCNGLPALRRWEAEMPGVTNPFASPANNAVPCAAD
jgi:hypothetical protein